MKSVDPVALFGNLGFLHTFNAESRDLAVLAPEDNYYATAGFALAMNDRLSLSTSINGTFTPQSEVAGVVFDSENVFNLRLALTSLIGERFYIEPAVSFRLNGPEDAFAFGLSLPYLFGN